MSTMMAPDETTCLLSNTTRRSRHERPESSDEEIVVTRNSTTIRDQETSPSLVSPMEQIMIAQHREETIFPPQHNKRHKSAGRSLVVGIVLVYVVSLMGLARQEGRQQEPLRRDEEDLYQDEMVNDRSPSSHNNRSRRSSHRHSHNHTTTTTSTGRHHDHNNDDERQHQVEWEGVAWNNLAKKGWEPPQAEARCEWVLARFFERDVDIPKDEALRIYKIQSQDPNVFYRATANVFWHDFVDHHWGDGLVNSIDQNKHYLKGGVPLTPFSTWTWVTGDQHLSNFGAWRNRHHDVVFGVNVSKEVVSVDAIYAWARTFCSHSSSFLFDA